MFRALLVAVALGFCSPLVAADFPGWQGLRVIHQEGHPYNMVAADLDGSGREQLVVVNTRQSRLDLYAWQTPDKRKAAPAADPLRPNDLPLAPDWNHREVTLDELPADVLVYDLDGDRQPKLLVLTSGAQKLIVYERDGDRGWKRGSHWDLLAGNTAGRRLMLLRERTGKKPQLLISFEQGIQTLDLVPGSRASWLSPREIRTRQDWKLVDLDGDGDRDLLESSNQPRQTVRWFECVDGELLPAQVLYELAVQSAGALDLGSKPAEVLLLGGTQDGVLRRYRLASGEESELGRQESLPMSGGAKAAWCGVMLGDRPALVAADQVQPRLRVHALGKNGWLGEQSYPAIGDVKVLAAPAAQPGSLLLWVKDAPDLYLSKWQSGRLTYPETLPPEKFNGAEVAGERRILALDQVGTTTWWAQRVGSDIDLYVWAKADAAAKRTRFKGLGAKTERVVWLGGQRLLVQTAYASGGKLATLDSDKLTTTEPGHLAKVDLSQYGLYPVGSELKVGRLTDGVLQWLGKDLHPEDQIMLPDGQRIGSYLPLAGCEAWVLEQGGVFLHKLKPDGSGIPRVIARLRLPHGNDLHNDPVLGLVLVDQDRVVRLSRGKPAELKLVDSIDGRVGRPSGVKEATIHRFFVADVTGDGQEEVILCDDRRHQLTLLERTEKELKPLMSWQVFDDQAYPYGDERETHASEPRAIVAFDADGDEQPDLGMLCHDRLLIYLSQDKQEAPHP